MRLLTTTEQFIQLKVTNKESPRRNQVEKFT